MVANSNSTNTVLVRRDYSDNNVSNHTCDLGNSQSFEMYISDRQRYPCNQGCGINLFQPALIKAPYINYACLFSNLILFYTNRLETCMHNNCIWLCGNFGQPFNFYFVMFVGSSVPFTRWLYCLQSVTADCLHFIGQKSRI